MHSTACIIRLDDNSVNNSISNNDKTLDRNDSCSRLSIEWSHRGRNHRAIPSIRISVYYEHDCVNIASSIYERI